MVREVLALSPLRPGCARLIIYDRAECARQYQFLQKHKDLIVLRVAASRMSTSQWMEKIHSDATRLIGEGARPLVRSAYDEIDWQRVGNAH